MVFQNYALFPHMSVARNVAYPLAMRGMAKAEIAKRVAAALDMVELGGMAERLPKQLSGGQQQRVALARATVFQPRLLLLDEPFGALDRKLREQMQIEVRRLQRRLGLTTLFITHDQEEALVMSDRIAVMDKGRLQQVGLSARDLRGPGQSVHRRLHRRVQHLRRRGRSRTAATCCGSGSSAGPCIEVAGRGDLAAGPGQQVRVMVRPERFVDLGGRRRAGAGQQDRRIGHRKRLHRRVGQIPDRHRRRAWTSWCGCRRGRAAGATARASRSPRASTPPTRG